MGNTSNQGCAQPHTSGHAHVLAAEYLPRTWMLVVFRSRTVHARIARPSADIREEFGACPHRAKFQDGSDATLRTCYRNSSMDPPRS